MEPKVLKTFACPKCGSIDTVTTMACAPLVEAGKMPKGTPVSLQKETIPLLEPTTQIATVPVMTVHTDVCADCGHRYVTRVETMDAPITFMKPGGKPFGMP